MSIRYQGPFDFEKVRAFDLYRTRCRGVIELDVLVTPLRWRGGSTIGYMTQIQNITERKLAEEVLMKDEKRFHSLFKDHDSVMLLIDGETGAIVDANLSAQRFYGKDRESLFQLRIEDINMLPPEEVRELKAKAMRSQRNHFVMPHRVANGGVKTVEVHSSPISIGGRQLLFSIINDVTDQVIMEQALRDSEEKFRHLFEMESDALFMIDKRDGRILEVNGAAERLYGYSRSEMLQMKSTDFSVQPEETTRAIAEEATDVPLRYHRKKDGSTFPLEITANHFEWMGIPIILCAMRDITKRKQAEEALLRDRQRLENVIDGTNVGTWEWNVQTGETFFNERWAQIVGYSLQDLEPVSIDTWMALAHPDDLHQSNVLLQRHFSGELPSYEFEGRMKHKEGHWVWVLDRGRVIERTADGKPLTMFGTHTDITERKRADEALYEANRKLNLLSSVTRHDIVNQLLVLQGQLALLQRGSLQPSSEAHLLKAEAAAKRISAMIQFTKEYEDLGSKAPVWASLGRQTAQALALLHPTGVELEDDTRGFEIFADPLSEKVPYNLIDNSMRHGEHVTRIKIGAEQMGDAMLIVYEDDGVGISAEDKKRLFERGFGKNHGLGLFLSREILAITGIIITETGKAGEGVRFEMLVPPGAWRLPPQIEQ